MEYRGKQYTIVQGIEPDTWRWTVHLDERTVKSGIATSRAAATIRVIWLVDNALAVPRPHLLFHPILDDEGAHPVEFQFENPVFVVKMLFRKRSFHRLIDS